MKAIKLALVATALTFSTAASAMPEAVPASWWDHMMFRLGVMADNPGFCKANPGAWFC